MTPRAIGWTFLASAAAVAALGVFASRRSRVDRMGGLGGRRYKYDYGELTKLAEDVLDPSEMEETTPNEFGKQAVSKFLFGDCWDFALLLHKKVGWPLAVVRGRGPRSHADNPEPAVHVVNVHPSGAYVDASGFVTEKELARRYRLRGIRVVPSTPQEVQEHAGFFDESDVSCHVGEAAKLLRAIRHPPFDTLDRNDARSERGKRGLGSRRRSDQPLGLRLEEDKSLHKLVAQADVSLPYPASDAVTGFVGCEAKRPQGGIMCAHELEDAFSDQPSPRGREVRQQLAEAVVPVREALRSKFGDRVRLYRSQRPGPFDKRRHVLSYTLDKNVALSFAGAASKPPPVLTDAEIDRMLTEYARTGRTCHHALTVPVRCYQRGEGGYYDIYDDGDYITDGEDLRRELRDRQQIFEEYGRDYAAAKARVVAVDLPVEDVVWVTDRMHQNEVIARNRSDLHRPLEGRVDRMGCVEIVGR